GRTSRSRGVGVIFYLAGGPSSLRSPANSGELRRTRRSLGEGGHPHRLCLRALRRSALVATTVRLVNIAQSVMKGAAHRSHFVQRAAAAGAVREQDVIPIACRIDPPRRSGEADVAE